MLIKIIAIEDQCSVLSRDTVHMPTAFVELLDVVPTVVPCGEDQG